MEDHFSSIRFLLISALIVMVGVIIASMVDMGIQEESKGMAKPTFLFLWLFTSTGKLFSFVQFIGFFLVLIGIFLGFDSINGERVSRTLQQTALAAHLSGFGDQCKIFSRCGHHRHCVGGHCPHHLRPRHLIDRSGTRFGRSLTSRHLPHRQHPLYRLLVGDINFIFRSLSEHCHVCSGLFSRVDILLLLHQLGGRFSG